MSAASAFTMGNFLCQLAVAFLLLKFVNFSFLVEFKLNVLKDVSSTKMPNSFAAVQVLTERTFFAFSSFLILLVESQRCLCSFSS